MSSLGLTPGTQLMVDLEDSLAFYISQRLQTSWSHLHFELSGAGVAVNPLLPNHTHSATGRSGPL